MTGRYRLSGAFGCRNASVTEHDSPPPDWRGDGGTGRFPGLSGRASPGTSVAQARVAAVREIPARNGTGVAADAPESLAGVRQGDAIYHGLAGHLLLGRGLHILRTRIIAPMEFRIAQVQERMNLKRKEAVEYIETIDADRRKWTRFLYGVDWADASLYDLVLNLEQMNLEEACEAICTLAQSKSFQPTAETQAAIEDLALASCVKANLAMNPATCDLQFEVVARGGQVSVKGDIDAPGQAKKIRGFVEAIPGVSKLSLEELALTNRL